MFKCLLLLADSVSFGKQIIYSLPEYIATPKFLDVGSLPQKFRRNPVLELLNRFLASYDYCNYIPIQSGTLTIRRFMQIMDNRPSLIASLAVRSTPNSVSP